MARPENGNYNSITGDGLATKAATDAYLSGWEAIWGSKKKEAVKVEEVVNTSQGSDVVIEDEASSQ